MSGLEEYTRSGDKRQVWLANDDDSFTIFDATGNALFKVYGDGRVEGVKTAVHAGSPQPVQLIENVEAGNIELQLIGNRFVRNDLVRSGDKKSTTSGADENGNAAHVGHTDYCLLVSRVTANSKTSDWNPFATYAGNARLTSSITYAAGVTGIKYDVVQAGSGTNFLTKTYSSDTSNDITYELEVFNLTALGAVNAYEQQVITDLGISWDFTTYPDWEDIESAVTSSSDRETIFAAFIPAHVSSYQPKVVTRLQNYGSNLAQVTAVDEGYLSATGVPTGTSPTGLRISETGFSFEAGSGNGATVRNKWPVSGGMEYTIALDYATTGYGVLCRLHEFDRDGIYVKKTTLVNTSAAGSGSVEQSITMQAETTYVIISALAQGGASDVIFTSIQLNEGSNALSFLECISKPATFGSRSVNQLRNGNGEENVQGWIAGDAAVELSHDGSDFVLNNGDASAASVYRRVPVDDYTFYVNITDTADSEATPKIYCQEEMATAPSGWSWTASNYIVGAAGHYSQSSAADELSGYFEGVVAVLMSVTDTTLNDEVQYREMMLVRGEFTLAQIQAMGYVSYSPILLHAIDSVADELKLIDGKPYIVHNVEVDDDWELGEPVVNTTALDTNGEFAADTDWTKGTNWTIAGGVAVASAVPNGQTIRQAPTSALAVGRYYLTKYTISGYSAGSVRVKIGNSYGTARSANGTYVEIVKCESISDTTIGLFAVGTTTLNADNLEIYEIDIFEAEDPTIEDISIFVDGSLIQPAQEDENHVVCEDGVIVYATHQTGIQALADGIKNALVQTAKIADLTPVYELAHISTAGLGASSNTVVNFADIDGFPDELANVKVLEETLDANVSSVDVYDNAIVINTDGVGTGAGDESCHLLLASGKPAITYTGA